MTLPSRTDRYPIDSAGSSEVLKRMEDCSQVGPREAKKALDHGLLVFGLAADRTWREVVGITTHKVDLIGPTFYRVFFAFPRGYMRTLNKDGILLVEVPPTHADLTGD